MTNLIKSKNTSIIFSALVAFVLIAGQPYSSYASDQPVLRDEIIDHVYTPLWMGDVSPLLKGEYKAGSSQNGSEQFELRDEMIDHVYTPLWKGDVSPILKGEYKAGFSQSGSEQFELRDEMINGVYTPLWMGD